MRLSVAVQHHPARAHLLPYLRDELGDVEVVVDPDPAGRPSAWRTYDLALDLAPDDCEWRIVLQDDATPCAYFERRAEIALDKHQGALVALYVGGFPYEAAQRVHAAVERGWTWVDLRRVPFVPTVALAWPRELICPFLCWARGRWDPANRGDDEVVADWLKREGRDVRVIASVPSLVQHHDREPSLFGNRASAGLNSARVAAVYGR